MFPQCGHTLNNSIVRTAYGLFVNGLTVTQAVVYISMLFALHQDFINHDVNIPVLKEVTNGLVKLLCDP